MGTEKSLSWFVVSALVLGIVGYGYGFVAAQPTIDMLGIVGAVALAAVAVVAVATLHHLGHLRRLRHSLSLRPLLDHLSVRTGLVRTGIAVLVGMNVGGFLGFVIGLRTAYSVAAFLSDVGLVAAVLAGAALLIGIVYAMRSRFRKRGER